MKHISSHAFSTGSSAASYRSLFLTLLMPQKHSSGSQQECGGAGGILDSVLDIVGQCTPPTDTGGRGKKTAPAAVLAGCGALDAHTIRTNCCALISLLASAVLATAATTTTGSDSQDVHLVAPIQEAGAQLEDSGNKGGMASSKDEDIIGGGDWNTFIPMSAKPNPDVVCLVRKKGWAARKQQEQQQQQRQHNQATMAGGAAIAKTLVLSQASGAKGRKARQRRVRRDAGAAGRIGSIGRTAPFPEGIQASGMQQRRKSRFLAEGLLLSPGTRPSGQPQARKVLSKAAPIGPDTNRNDHKLMGGAGRSGERAGGRSVLADRDARLSGGDRQGRHAEELRGSVSDFLASPPRLTRATREGALPSLGPTSSGRSSPPAFRREVVPMGLSTPGGGNRKIAPKVRYEWAERVKPKMILTTV